MPTTDGRWVEKPLGSLHRKMGSKKMMYFLRKNNKTLFMTIVLSLSTSLYANDLTSHNKIKN